VLLAIVLVITVGCGTKSTPVTANPTSAVMTDGSAGLLVIAHGAPMPAWNKPVLALEKQVIKALGPNSPFRKVKVVLMEFAKPSVADGVAEMEQAGCSRIVAVPLLIAPSSHSHWDIPALLGLYSDEKMKADLAEEGATIVKSKLPITITATLDSGELLVETMLARVKELSKNPAEEAVVVLAHGDDGLKPYWDALMKRITYHICGKTGITCADWAYVHVGQGYRSHGVPAIMAAAENRKRVLLVGCYVSMGAAGMHKRFMGRPMRIHGMALPNPLKGKDIIAARHGLLPNPEVAKWIAKTAKAAMKD
jgi:hypothetical protein